MATPIATNILRDALAYLARLDPDAASERNDAGFNKPDSGPGARYAAKLVKGHRLTGAEYAHARRLIQKYRKQVAAGTGLDVEQIPADAPAAPVGPWSQPEPSRYLSRCVNCQKPITAGAMSQFRRGDVGWERKHAQCSTMATAPVAPATRPESTLAAPQAAMPSPGRVLSDGELDDLLSEYGITSASARPVPAIATAPGSTEARRVLGPGGSIARSLPGYEHREAQLQMADLVEQAIRSRGHAVIEAGTGTGKSLGYLVPAILSGRKAIVSTADKALQAQIVGKDIPFLQAEGHMPRSFKAALLKGRSNYVCLNRTETLGEQLITELEPAADAAWPKLAEWVTDQDASQGYADLDGYNGDLPGSLRAAVTVDSDLCIGKKCPQYTRCFVERAKQDAKVADVIIVNHALLLRDAAVRIASEGQASVIPEADMVILDEAHHLEDVATDALGSELTLSSWRRVIARMETLTIKHKAMVASKANDEEAAARALRAEAYQGRWDLVTTPLEAAFAAIDARLDAAKATAQRLGDEADTIAPATDACVALSDAWMDSTPTWLDDAERESWRKLGRFLAKLARTMRIIAQPIGSENWVRYAERERMRDGGSRLKLVCKPIDVSEYCREAIWESYDSAIACSATITTASGFDSWRERVGLDHAAELVVTSPFNYGTNALLYLPGNGKAFVPAFSEKENIGYTLRLANEIEQLLKASNGRAFVLFTSYRQLKRVHEMLAPRLNQWTVLVQGDKPRPALVAAFKADGNAVLFGTKSFWEGVDVQGEALSMVIIDKLPFAPPDDPTWEAKCEQVNRKAGSEWAWFQKLAIPAATIALKQGFGRLIRTASDRGVVAILDGRLTEKGYGSGIVRALPPASKVRDMADVQRFFA